MPTAINAQEAGNYDDNNEESYFYFIASVNPLTLIAVDLLVPQTSAFEGEVGYKINKLFRVRANFASRRVSHNAVEGIESIADSQFNGKQDSFSAMFDWYPVGLLDNYGEESLIRNIFYGIRVTVGGSALLNDLTLSKTHPIGRIRIGNQFTDDQTTTTVRAVARYAWPVMPYIGLGYDFPIYDSKSVFIGSRMEAGFYFGGGLKLVSLDTESVNAEGDQVAIPSSTGIESENNRIATKLSQSYRAIFNFALTLSVGVKF